MSGVPEGPEGSARAPPARLASAAWRRLLLMLVWLATAGVAMAWAGGAAAQTAPRRVALVIANGAYVHTGSLKNPTSDAEIVRQSLRRAGFELVEASNNLGVAPFRDALRKFSGEAAGAEVALVYYAGHGIEAAGRNWLIPTDAVLQRDADLDYEAIDIDLVLKATDGAKIRVVVLDACRNNPFGHNWRQGSRAVAQGLAPVDVDDVLVIYSAAPGQTASDGSGANSPFAEALSHRLPQAGLPIQMLGGMVRDDVLEATGGQQRPYISASITGSPFMLVGGGQAAGATARSVEPSAPPATPAMDPNTMELALWNAVGASNDPAQLRAYIDRYPDGVFAEAAQAKIAALTRPPPAVAIAAGGASTTGSGPAPAAPRHSAPCAEGAALACLPKSSAPVTFADEVAANRAAAENVRGGLSTSEAEAVAVRDGATGKAARLCGILGSNDSSPFGKHLAAVRLGGGEAVVGRATSACVKLAADFR